MTLLDELLDDLATEGDALRATVAGLHATAWATPTPAPGWTVATQVGHLVWTDEAAVSAASSVSAVTPGAAPAWDALVAAGMHDPAGFIDAGALQLAALAPAELLARWDASRPALAAALREVPAGTKLPWFGPPMSPTSMATARFMETWAHGLDVYAALGATPEPTDRTRHVAHLGVRTRDFAYAVHGQTPPEEEFRVELTAPTGERWTWGPEDSTQSVSGPALDFCLLVTQRVHRDDTALVADGADAAYWLTIAQAFAGPVGVGRGRR